LVAEDLLSALAQALVDTSCPPHMINERL
jgi:hypothetical protein